jgi:hypothetical protein
MTVTPVSSEWLTETPTSFWIKCWETLAMPDAVKLFSEIDQQFLELEQQFEIIKKQREEIELCKKKTLNVSKETSTPHNKPN